MPRKKKEDPSSIVKPTSETDSAKQIKKVIKATLADTSNNLKSKMGPSKTKRVSPPTGNSLKKDLKTSSVRKTRTIKKEKTSDLNLDPIETLSTSTFRFLPRQGETQLVAFVRDPHCVFTYWEVTPEKLEEVKKELKEEFHGSYMVLRLYHVETNGERILVDEIRLEPSQMNYYVDLKETGKTYVLEIAQKTSSGRYIAYAQSNQVLTGSPTYGESAPENQTRIFLEEGMSQDLLNYYQNHGYDSQFVVSLSENSSAGNLQKVGLKNLRNVNRSSFF